MSFNLAVILGEGARSAPGQPVALFRSELRESTLQKALEDQLALAKTASSADRREAG
jgi:hypothetical protein